MKYNIQCSKGAVKKLAGNWGVPQEYPTKKEAQYDLNMLKRLNETYKIYNKIELVKVK